MSVTPAQTRLAIRAPVGNAPPRQVEQEPDRNCHRIQAQHQVLGPEAAAGGVGLAHVLWRDGETQPRMKKPNVAVMKTAKRIMLYCSVSRLRP